MQVLLPLQNPLALAVGTFVADAIAISKLATGIGKTAQKIPQITRPVMLTAAGMVVSEGMELLKMLISGDEDDQTVPPNVKNACAKANNRVAGDDDPIAPPNRRGSI